MKKRKIKMVLGATLLLTAITNAETVKYLPKKDVKSLGLISKVKDKTNDESRIKDGAKTERTGK